MIDSADRETDVTLNLTPDNEAALRHLFEHKAFGRYFLSQIGRTGLGGPIEFLPKQDTMHMREFIQRDEDGYYMQPGLEAAWWGFNEAARHTSPQGLEAMLEHAKQWGWPTPHPWLAAPDCVKGIDE